MLLGKVLCKKLLGVGPHFVREHVAGVFLDEGGEVLGHAGFGVGFGDCLYAFTSFLDWRAAVGFTEGGGARLFREGAKLNGNTVNKMTAKAMQTIYDDEEDHYQVQAKEAIQHINSDADLQTMIDAIIAISVQRVRMRAEMFRDAMTLAEIDAFIEAEKAKLS